MFHFIRSNLSKFKCILIIIILSTYNFLKLHLTVNLIFSIDISFITFIFNNKDLFLVNFGKFGFGSYACQYLRNGEKNLMTLLLIYTNFCNYNNRFRSKLYYYVNY